MTQQVYGLSIWISYIIWLHQQAHTFGMTQHEARLTWLISGLIWKETKNNKQQLARGLYISICASVHKLCKCLGCSGWNFFIWSLKFFFSPRISSMKFKLAVAKIQIGWNMSYIMRPYRSSSIKDPASILGQCGENAKGLKFLLKKLV